VMAGLALDLGDAPAAVDLLEPVLRRVPAVNGTLRAAPLEVMVMAKVATGDTEAAASHITELRSIADALGTRPLRASLSLAEGLVSAAAGDHDTARERLEDALELFAASGASFELARARLELARILVSLGRDDAAVREATLALTHLEETGAVAEAARARDLLRSLGASPRPTRGSRRDQLLTPREVEILRIVSRTHRSRRGSCSASTPFTATFRTPMRGWVARRGRPRWRRRTDCTCCSGAAAWPRQAMPSDGLSRRRRQLRTRRYSRAIGDQGE